MEQLSDNKVLNGCMGDLCLASSLCACGGEALTFIISSVDYRISVTRGLGRPRRRRRRKKIVRGATKLLVTDEWSFGWEERR